MELACNLAGIFVGVALATYLVLKGQCSRFGLRKWLTIACLVTIAWWVISINDDITDTAALLVNVNTRGGVVDSRAGLQDLLLVVLDVTLDSPSPEGLPDWSRISETVYLSTIFFCTPQLDNRPPPYRSLVAQA
jgi:hypothetical protein